MAETPEPGIYEGVDFQTYCDWDALNLSTLMHGRKSAKHLKAAIDGRMEKETEDRKFGADIHAAILEPERFKNEYTIAGQCQASIASGPNAGQRCPNGGTKVNENGDWYCGVHGKGLGDPDWSTAINEDKKRKIDRIMEEMTRHDAVKIIRAHGGCEVSVVWEYNGVLLKSRFDKFLEKPLCIVDLKKTQVGAADQQSFGAQACKLGYDMKAAAYCLAIEQLKGETPIFVWVAIEDDEPHDIGVYTMPDSMRSGGRMEFDRLLSMYKRGFEADYWPGVCFEIKEALAPVWYRKQVEQMTI